MIEWNLPSDWGTQNLGDIAPEATEQITPSDTPDAIFNYWGLDAIQPGGFSEPAPNYIKGNEILSTCIKFSSDHILYSKLRPYLNKVIIPSISGIGSTEWVVLNPNPSLINRQYLGYVLRTQKFVDYANYYSAGGRMPRAKKSALWIAEIPIPYPDKPAKSLTTQINIVSRIEAIFSELAEARRLHEKIVADTNRLMDAALKEIFADLTSRYPTEDLNDDSICRVIPGQHIMAEDYSNTPGSGLPYITGPEDFRDIYPVISKWTEERKVIAHPGDVLFTVKGSGVGKVNLMIDADCVIGRQVMAIRPNREMLLDEYLFYALLGRYQEFQSMRQGAAIPGIRKEHVRAIKLPLPPTDTQASIVTRLGEYKKAIQQMVEDQTRTKVLLNQMEQSILAQAFRGEL